MTAPLSSDNASACAMIKEQNKLTLNTHKGTTASAAEADDMSKAHTDDQIFSACASPEDELEDAAGADLDSYELNYLHQLYTVPDDGMMVNNFADAILPDAVAPPSLGMSAQVHAALRPESPRSTSTSRSAISHATTEGDGQASEHNISQPSTPPRADTRDEAPWSTEPEASPVVASSARIPKTTGRKRKASTLRGSPTPAPPAKQSRAAAAAAAREAKEAAAREAAASEEDSDDDSVGGNPTLDGLEIRPEDDPLGLFSRDPATLTPEEQRLLKKQRRLLKNRESAQLSRHRKKMHLHSLEKMVDALKKDKSQLASKVQALAEDNERLRKQLISLSA